MIIELRATYITAEGDFDWCEEKEAEQYSVYFGEPDPFWLADFYKYEDAAAWANCLARSRGAGLHDYVAAERERKAKESVVT